MTALRVVIVDSGLRGLGGHNFSYTEAVRSAFERSGASVHVLASRGVPSALADAHGFHPVFSCGAYDHPPGHGRLRDLVYLYAQSHVFTEELDHGLRCVIEADPDLVLCHTVADFELLGWARHLRRHGFSGVLAILLRQTPRFRACGRLRRTLNPYWRLKPHCLARMRTRLGSRFLLCTDSEPLSEDYASVYGGRVLTLPIPLNPALFEPRGQAPRSFVTCYGLAGASALRVGYVGDARPSKGFPLLPSLVAAVAAAGETVHFVIQCPRPGSGDDHASPPAGLADLQALAGDPRFRVTLIAEKLSSDDYAALLRSLDVVLLPYAHQSYREATSGIFAEALALGKPVVVPSGTWMARELEKTGAGAVFSREQPADLAAKVLEVVRDHSRLAAAAARAGDAWRAFHSPDTLVDTLLREAGLADRVRLLRRPEMAEETQPACDPEPTSGGPGFWRGRRVLVTGAAGFVGSNLVPMLRRTGCELITPTRGQYDLTEQAEVRRLFADTRPDLVFHLAGLVGGILVNERYPADFCHQNLLMGTLVLHEAWKSGAGKYVTLVGGCSYPARAPSPIAEDELWNGYPQSESAPYSLAKRMAVVEAAAYRQQHGFNAVVLVPGNLYGPHDNFDLEAGHVIPALIRKFKEAVSERRREVTAWGTGRPVRDFVYVEDACEAILIAAEKHDRPEIVNISSGVPVTIREVVETVAELAGYDGRILWDSSKPDGQMAKGFDVTRMKSWLGYECRTPLREGLRKTLAWFESHYATARLKASV